MCRGRGRPRADAQALSREDILERAFRAFVREGYDGLSMRQLATECGISNTLLHHHFATKAALWLEVADSRFRPLFESQMAVLDTLRPGGVVVETLRDAMLASFRLAGEQPEALVFMFNETERDNERGEYLRQHYINPYVARMNTLLAQGRDQGAVNSLPVAGMHAMVVGMLRFLTMPGLLREELSPHLSSPEAREQFCQQLVELALHGMQVRVDQSPPSLTR